MQPTIDSTIAFLQRLGLADCTETGRHVYRLDKSGQLAFVHPVAVMQRLPEGAPEFVCQAALLHDVLEDTPYTLDCLRAMGYAEETLAIVSILTRQEGEPYLHFVRRIIDSGNPWAIRVKYADICENSSRPRLALLPDEVRGAMIAKYAYPKQMLAREVDRLDRQEAGLALDRCMGL